MIKVILFDVDGVLIIGQYFSNNLEKDYGITIEQTWPFFSGEFLECIIGKKDLKDILPRYLKNWRWRKTVDEFVEYWLSYASNLNEDLISYIQNIRKKGIECYIATNQEKHRAKHLIESLGFENKFDEVFASVHLGYRKPDLNFFRKIWKKIGKPDKKTILFWDDNENNVTAAREFGIHAERYSSFGNLKLKMRNYLK